MALCYKFYRNNLIKLALLSVGYLVILIQYLRGAAQIEPGVMIFLGVIAVIGNLWLFIGMRRAKRREQLEVTNVTRDA